ncbi:hypothetical protein MMC25_004323 [Agyrium rufum]|nr:hypothetical protein [Agyrium rufum]
MAFEPSTMDNVLVKAGAVEQQYEAAQQAALPTNSMVTIMLSDGSTLEPAEMVEHQEIGMEEEKVTKLPEKTMVLEIPTEVDAADKDDAESITQSREAYVASPSVLSPADSPRTSEVQLCEPANRMRSRSSSMKSGMSSESHNVDWEELDKTEEQTQKEGPSDDATALLLARLEKENNALAVDPKAANTKPRQSISRPPSMQQLRKLVSEPIRSSLRYSLLPSPPPMTELEFWSALVSNYPQTAQRLPTLTSHKIRGGIPPPLRGVVWMSIAGARENFLETEYERLITESSPYEKLIGKDIGRSYPGVDMFRDPKGDGQQMLGKVLNAFSLWDSEIGYCQGLGFVVGPLIMHMADRDAFCVLVRLMEHYDLRSCFLPNLAGLHLRIFQFQLLLQQHLPTLAAHLDKLNVEPLYLSQWFLSFFGVTCPLPMLLRIYDVILTEGASETLMRVALSLMRRNEQRILAATEFEDIMSFLLSRGLWDTYECNADDLVNDFCSFTGSVTRETLESLEVKFKANANGDPTSPLASRPDVHSAASGFLGRFWAGSSSANKLTPLTPSLTAPSRPISYLRRSPSKQSMASTLNSIEGAESNSSTASNSSASTDATDVSRQMSAEWVPLKPATPTSSTGSATVRTTMASKDKNLHAQIEELLTAMSDLQRENARVVSDLQREREEREEDRKLVCTNVEKMKQEIAETLGLLGNDNASAPTNFEKPTTGTGLRESSVTIDEHCSPLDALAAHFSERPTSKRTSVFLSKHQLRDDANRWKDSYDHEAARCAALTQRIADHDRDTTSLRDQLREARQRIQDSHRENQRLERNLQEIKTKRKSNGTDSAPETPSSATSEYFPPSSSSSSLHVSTTSSSGLREFRLGRPAPSRHVSTASSPSNTHAPSASTPTFSKRVSSLSTQTVLATEDHKPATEDALLLELVTAKTDAASARQELDEVKGKLDALRRLVAGSGDKAAPGSAKLEVTRSSTGFNQTIVTVKTNDNASEANGIAKIQTPGSGGFFSGWGKRVVS